MLQRERLTVLRKGAGHKLLMSRAPKCLWGNCWHPCMTEFERIDTTTKVSALSSHLALPREGRMEAAVHVMAYVGQKYNSRLVSDLKYQI